MKKTTASLGLVAAVGLSALAVSPAMAAPFVFDNCTQAEQYGVFNIPAGSPGYGTHLDQPVDGVGCEKDGAVYNPALVPAGDPIVTPTPTPAPAGGTVVTPPAQVAQMPVGGAATGVPMKTDSDAGTIALSSGLVLAAAAGGVLMVRRRASQA